MNYSHITNYNNFTYVNDRKDWRWAGFYLFNCFILNFFDQIFYIRAPALSNEVIVLKKCWHFIR